MALTAEQLIKKAHITLIGHKDYALYGGVIMTGAVKFTDTIPTASTNGRDVSYNPDYVNSLNFKELCGLVMHENLHKALKQLITWGNLCQLDACRANRACDYVINQLIADSEGYGDTVLLPPGALLNPAYKGMDSGQVFKLLEASKAHGQALDAHDWAGAEALSDGEREELNKAIDQALRQGAMAATKLAGGIPRAIADALKPPADWRAALRDFVTAHNQGEGYSTWAKPRRRYIAQNIYMPTCISESIGSIVVAVDTSGSIDGPDIGQFLAEISAICSSVRPEALDLLYWDTEVAAHEHYQGSYETLGASTKPAGGGGTDVSCVFDYISAKKIEPVLLICLTDGQTPWPDRVTCPTLFGITDKTIVAPIGRTIHI